MVEELLEGGHDDSMEDLTAGRAPRWPWQDFDDRSDDLRKTWDGDV